MTRNAASDPRSILLWLSVLERARLALLDTRPVRGKASALKRPHTVCQTMCACNGWLAMTLFLGTLSPAAPQLRRCHNALFGARNGWGRESGAVDGSALAL